MAKKPKSRQVSVNLKVKLTPADAKRLKAAAQADDRSVSKYLERLVKRVLDAEEDKKG